MKIDDVRAMLPEITNAEQMTAALEFMLECEDVSDSNRCMLCTGYLIGLAYALDKHMTGQVMPDVAEEIEKRNAEWAKREWMT